MILFSIIIPTYNRAAFIKKAVDSVLAQTYANWELLIIDDASTDNTAELLTQYYDARIHILKNESNIERSASRNKGIAQAKGDYICFLDSDDYFLPQHLASLQLSISKSNQSSALFHTGVEQHIVQQGIVKKINRQSFRNPVETVIACHIPVITVAIHQKILKQFQFDESMRINEDVYLFAQIASCYPLIYIPEVSVVWQLHGNNTSDSEKDYLYPQLKSTKVIFSNSLIIAHLSRPFVNAKYFDLYAQMVYLYASTGKLSKALYYLLMGVYTIPFHRKNLTNLMNVIYHMPGGAFLKRLIFSLR
jgi:glycosyltransferase involved in cell wall biosynthesis